MIAGPGMDPPAPAQNGPVGGAIAAAAAAATSPMSDRQQRDLDAAQRAGSAGGGEQTKNVPTLKTEKRLGRNDTCPQGTGRKYKKCCNRPDGTCNGQGLTNPAAGDDQ